MDKDHENGQGQAGQEACSALGLDGCWQIRAERVPGQSFSLDFQYPCQAFLYCILHCVLFERGVLDVLGSKIHQ